MFCIALPLLIFDGQLLFNYGLFSKRHMCDEIFTDESKQFQRALHLPLHIPKSLTNNMSIRYYQTFSLSRTSKPNLCIVCILWNILDTFVYAIIPFLVILISSIIIIVKICERRRSTVTFGGFCHMNRRMSVTRDHLSILLIIINCLFLIMTGPLNISFIVQSIIKYFSFKCLSPRFFFRLNQPLRLLQNSYHAFSFIFYCVNGNKFRQSAWLSFRKIYYKICRLCFNYQPKKSIYTHKQSISTSINDFSKPISMKSIKKHSPITIISSNTRRKHLQTPV